MAARLGLMRSAPKLAVVSAGMFALVLSACHNEERDRQAAVSLAIKQATEEVRAAASSGLDVQERTARMRSAAAKLESIPRANSAEQARASMLAATSRNETAVLELMDAQRIASSIRASIEQATVLAQLAGDLESAAISASAPSAPELAPILQETKIAAETAEQDQSLIAEQSNSKASRIEARAAEGRLAAEELSAEAFRIWGASRSESPMNAIALIDQSSALGDQARRIRVSTGHSDAEIEQARAEGTVAQGGAEGHGRIAEAAARAEQNLDALLDSHRARGSAHRQASDAAVRAVSDFVAAVVTDEETGVSEALTRSVEDFEKAISDGQLATRGSAQLTIATAQAGLASVWMTKQALAAQQAQLMASLAANPAFAADGWADKAESASQRAEQAKGKALEAVDAALSGMVDISDTPGVAFLEASLKSLRSSIELDAQTPIAETATSEAMPAAASDAGESTSMAAKSSSSSESSSTSDPYFDPAFGAESPEAVAAALIAMGSGDAAGLTAAMGLLGAADAQDATTAKTLAGMGRAMAPFLVAMQAKFGAAAMVASGGGSNPLAGIATAVVSSQDAANAIITCTDKSGKQTDVVSFAAEGKWYIDAGSLLDDQARGQLAQVGGMLKMAGDSVGTAAAATAERVTAGEFSSAEEATKALSGAIQMEVMKKMGQVPPGAARGSRGGNR